MNKTKEVCQKALALSPNQKLSEKLRKLLLVAAVNTSDVNLFNSLKNKVTDLQPYERIWLKGMELKFAESSLEALRVLRFTESENTTNEQWLSLASILQQRAENAAIEKTSWLLMAKICLEHAEETEPNNVEVRIMVASIAEKLGHKQDALKKITAGWNDTPCEPSPKAIYANDRLAKADVTQLAKGFVKGAKGYHNHLATIEVRIPQVTCRCRYKVFRYAAMNLPGVINVMIGPGEHPSALVLFDSRKSSKKSIFDSKALKAVHENLEIGQERPFETIAALGDATRKFEVPLASPSFFAESITLQFPSIDSAHQAVAGSTAGAVN